jgi:hypothetical protein
MSRTFLDLDLIDTEWRDASVGWKIDPRLILFAEDDEVIFCGSTVRHIAAMVAALADTLADEGIDVPGWRQEREL